MLKNDNLISEFLNNPENYNFALQPSVKEEGNYEGAFLFVPKLENFVLKDVPSLPLSLPPPTLALPQQQQQQPVNVNYFTPNLITPKTEEGSNGLVIVNSNSNSNPNQITISTNNFRETPFTFNPQTLHSIITAPLITTTPILHHPALPRRKVWWVNQKYADTKGDLIDYTNGVGTLDSFHNPHKKIPSWSRILEAKPDDIIVHYGKQKIFAVSKMKQVILDPPQSDGTSVITAHIYSVTKLSSPIPYLLFKEPLINLGIPRGPMNRRQTNQGYFFCFSWEGIDLLKKLDPDVIWPEWVRSD
eukprot:TRINITY_DN1698_c0_g1_i2.p1 TRINITY_DN1698_c0_g1~~TRINITY_DN1698_c0_g1_i2.p1  ORF type:complete len:302 (+),score=60.65 TRINITY_DN1698_c0_g1_i2:215-1120(+)